MGEEKEVVGTNPVPFYKSTKKTLGVVFAAAVLLGGIYGIYRDPNQTVRVIETWGMYSGALLGIKAIGGALQSRGTGK